MMRVERLYSATPGYTGFNLFYFGGWREEVLIICFIPLCVSKVIVWAVSSLL